MPSRQRVEIDNSLWFEKYYSCFSFFLVRWIPAQNRVRFWGHVWSKNKATLLTSKSGFGRQRNTHLCFPPLWWAGFTCFFCRMRKEVETKELIHHLLVFRSRNRNRERSVHFCKLKKKKKTHLGTEELWWWEWGKALLHLSSYFFPGPSFLFYSPPKAKSRWFLPLLWPEGKGGKENGSVYVWEMERVKNWRTLIKNTTPETEMAEEKKIDFLERVKKKNLFSLYSP